MIHSRVAVFDALRMRLMDKFCGSLFGQFASGIATELFGQEHPLVSNFQSVDSQCVFDLALDLNPDFAVWREDARDEFDGAFINDGVASKRSKASGPHGSEQSPFRNDGCVRG